MKNSRWLVLVLIVFFTACKNEDTLPYLDIKGHWIVDHGFHDDCQVSATFTDQVLVLSFYSLADGACEPERYGIKNNALAIQIDNKEDYFNDQGVLSTELLVSVPEQGVSGTLVLTQKGSGIEGSIVTAMDPEGRLEPLLRPTYVLSRVSEKWVPLALGTWGPECIEVSNTPFYEYACTAFRFDDAVSGQTSFTGGGFGGIGNADIKDVVGVHWTESTFALRHLTAIDDKQFKLDMVTFRPEAPEGSPSVFLLSEGKLVILDKNGEPFFELNPAE